MKQIPARQPSLQVHRKLPATAFDYFGNSWDSLSFHQFQREQNAGGSLSGNVYTSANAGTWTVTVMSLGLSATASLTVTHASPIGITVGPNSASVNAGSNQAFTATASDSYGNVWDITALTGWSVSSGAEGSWINNQYTAAVAGNWIITGTYSELSNYAYLAVNHASAVSLSVSPAQQPLQQVPMKHSQQPQLMLTTISGTLPLNGLAY